VTRSDHVRDSYNEVWSGNSDDMKRVFIKEILYVTDSIGGQRRSCLIRLSVGLRLLIPADLPRYLSQAP